MIKELLINDFFIIYNEIQELYEQDLKIKINTSLKLLRLYNQMTELHNYIIERILKVIPNFFDSNHIFNEEEKIIYNHILENKIEIDNQNITIEELLENEDIQLKIKGLEKLKLIF